MKTRYWRVTTDGRMDDGSKIAAVLQQLLSLPCLDAL